MAIPKKGSRTLTVDGVQYRWVVSIHDNSVNLVVELMKEPGQRLLAYFECRDLYIRGDDDQWRFHSQKQCIRPAHVVRIINHALREGWEPSVKPGKQFVVRDAAKVALTIDAELINSQSVDHDSKAAHIKEIAQDFLESYMGLSLCMDYAMHDQIMDSEPKVQIPIEDHNMQRLGLTFSVFKDSLSPDGRLVITLQCNEFPDISDNFWWMM
ncbi:hypothetical protein [uncultured Gimesia sp.]|mgnify:CR=1 FL=1|uniref:hypothetical protein n=1 Tax=uncultured Gimesia sp. TaxID=1678688 RepID=UPI002610BED8|nr:hypothetical protein [uncultured Gimesia sp.]